MEPLAHVFPPIWVNLLHFIKIWRIALGIAMHSSLVQLLNALKCLKHPLAGKYTLQCSLVTSLFSMQSACL